MKSNANFMCSHGVNLGRFHEAMGITRENPLYLIRKTEEGYVAGIAVEQTITGAERTVYGYSKFKNHQFVEGSLKEFATYEEAQAYVNSLGEQNQKPLKLCTSLL